MKIEIKQNIIQYFHPLWDADDYYEKIIAKGGRDSGKTCQIALKIVYKRMKHLASALVVRKTANTLRDSVFQDIKWAISHLNVEHLWKETISPMCLLYRPTGTQILFRGAENPQRIKGIKAKYPISDLWIDELAEFKTEDEIDTIEDSVLRANLSNNLKYTFFYSYNPPARKSWWGNKKYNARILEPNTFVHHSTLFQNPFASVQLKAKALTMKRTNNAKYRWMYLGEAIGGGIVPFENLKIKQISDETIKTFDNIKQGIDWGYSSDAFCFGRLHYDKLHDSLFIFDQLYGIKISEVRICAFLAQKKYFERIVADCSEPRSIDRLKDKGFNVVGAKKGAGSVEFGEKWLSERTSLVIDPARCPDIAWEFENIDYQTDRFGEVIPRLEDKYNHSIDMTRYALEDDMRVSDGIW